MNLLLRDIAVHWQQGWVALILTQECSNSCGSEIVRRIQEEEASISVDLAVAARKGQSAWICLTNFLPLARGYRLWVCIFGNCCEPVATLLQQTLLGARLE